MGTKYQESTGSAALKMILSIILLLLILVMLIVLAYILYQNIPGEPKNLSVFIKPIELETGNLSYKVKQFHPNMKFNHNDISYKIGVECDEKKKKRVLDAFYELENRVGLIRFYEATNDNPDIDVACSDQEIEIEKDYFIAGEGGAKEIIQTKRYNVITEGIIFLHENPHDFNECEWPNIELHELLHVFGFDHSLNEESLMYPYLSSCSQKLDESIVSDLKILYSQENLPDLYFAQAIAIKRGRYLDFNISVKNAGVIDAKNVIISVFDSGQRLEDFNLNSISFGAGVNFYVTNLKLISRDSKDLSIKIDPDNVIREIDEENNIAYLNFN